MLPLRATCTSWSWSLLPFAEVARIMSLLGFHAIDVGAFSGWTHFEPNDLAADPHGSAARIRASVSPYEMQLTDLFVTFGPGLDVHCVNDPDRSIRDRNLETFKRLTEFCQAANIPGISLCPGVEHAMVGRQASLEISVEELTRLAQAGHDAGIRVSFEPHVESITESPSDTLAVVQSVPHLTLTLDFSHFIYQGYSQAELEVLLPHTGHYHLRQAAPGAIQCRFSEGTIDFPRAMDQLIEGAYQGYAAFEYVWEQWMDNDRVDVLSETLLLRRQLQQFITDEHPAG